MSPDSGSSQARELEMIMDIPVKLTVELGRTKLTIKQLLELAQGSVIELEGLAGEPMDILINGYLIAQGKLSSLKISTVFVLLKSSRLLNVFTN
ncbi:hypothetical protein HSBAA_01660 [Vreelandella sulfidaeris]|uniref:Flagellar motor switch protein FliN n=1 Tax=Vreelandella sulfidaeris TaxID=115553 RepID=A0A455TZD2_9GAMM|nr:hypothetical protein HSBAA_01660 [Halomonas sulfidaeris]